MPLPDEWLVSYVPALVARRFAADPAPLAGPELTRLPAAVLFADVAGSTALAAHLAQRGPVGAEMLTRLLNEYFGWLLALIDAHGGEAVKFAGDGLLAIWPPRGPAEPLADAGRRAAQCALAIQQSLGRYDMGEGLPLALRVSVAAGDVLALHVGGVTGRWYFLLAGDPLRQLRLAADHSEAGEIVISPECWEHLGAAATGTPADAGFVRLTGIRAATAPIAAPPVAVPVSAHRALEAYVAGPVRGRLAAGHADWLAELRRVSVMFLGLPDLDATSPEALTQAQAVVVAAEPIFDRYEGLLHELIVDDKGATLIGLFGVPPLAHEDDAARCVQAALELQAALAAQGRRTAIGMTTGRAFCGPVGSDLRREYTVVGETMNVAARLMSQAPDQILCDATTVEAGRHRVAFAPLAPVQIKGLAQPLAVFRPSGHAPAAAPASPATRREARPLVGRVTERTVFSEALAALDAGRGGVVLLEGDAGLGKSRLLETWLTEAARRGLPTLVGAADAIERSTPYYAWRPIVTQLFGLEPLTEGDTAARRQHVLRRLADDPTLLRWAPLLASVISVDLRDTDFTRAMAGDVRAANLRELLVTLFQRMVSGPEGQQSIARPHVVVLDDAHWLDSPSWALAWQLHRQVAPLLLVLASRPLPDPLPPDYVRLRDSPATRRLVLDALPPDDTVALVARRLDVDALPDAVAALIVERAEGNPFYSEELGLALRDAGLIRVADGACALALHAGDLRALALPDTVQGVITSRIDRLTPRQQLALKVASVIGRVFPYRMLREVHPVEVDRPHLRQELQVLERLDLTPRDAPEPDLAYVFKHIITRDTAYNLLPFAQRRHLHRAVAEWYERAPHDGPAAYYPLLAHHWGRADDVRRTIGYLEKAGEQALHHSAYQEAVAFFTEALRLDPLAASGSVALRRARWERQLGDAHMGLGQLRQSTDHFDRALALLGRPRPTSRPAVLAALGGQVARQLMHRLAPGRMLGRAGADRATLLESARAAAQLAEIQFVGQNFLSTLLAMLDTLNAAEAAGPSPELARAYANMCMGAGLIPLRGLAERYGEWARQTARRVDDPAATAWVLMVTGLYDTGVGHWERARQSLEEATAIADRLGDWRRREEFWLVLASPLVYQGELARAAEIGATMGASAARRGDDHHRAIALIAVIEHALSIGESQRAVDLAEEAIRLLRDTPDHSQEIKTNGLLALACLRQGDAGRARDAADRAARLIAQVPPMASYAREGYSGVVETYLALWEAGELACAQPARDACRALRRYARVFPIAEARAWVYQGLADALDRWPTHASLAWERGLAAAERLALPYEQARARYELGRHLPATARARREHLERARAGFAALGATYDVGLTDTLV